MSNVTDTPRSEPSDLQFDTAARELDIPVAELKEAFQAMRARSETVPHIPFPTKAECEAFEAAPSAIEPTRDEVLEEAALEVLRYWKTAPNIPPAYTQNTVSHGCIAAASVIRAMKGWK